MAVRNKLRRRRNHPRKRTAAIGASHPLLDRDSRRFNVEAAVMIGPLAPCRSRQGVACLMFGTNDRGLKKTTMLCQCCGGWDALASVFSTFSLGDGGAKETNNNAD